MKAVVFVERGRFEVQERPRPVIRDPRDAIVRVTTASICTSDLHIRAGAVPRAVPGTIVGHEFVGVVEEVGDGVTGISPGDRAAPIPREDGHLDAASTADRRSTPGSPMRTTA